MDQQKLITEIEQLGIVVIVRGVAKEDLIPLSEAMYAGGIRFLEITFRADGSVSDEETANRIAMLKQHFGERMHIGAGTVLTTDQVELTEKAGGEFIISPNVNEAVIQKTKQLGLISMPGAYTPSEVVSAREYGADFVKLFPVTALGPDYVKAIKAPLSHVKLLAVGGVDLSNMADYLAAGISGFGIGSNIVDKKMLKARDFEGITQLAAQYVAAFDRG